MSDHPRDPFRALLDLTVYAPIGAALHGPEAVEELARKGRQDVGNAKVLGRVALDRARRQLDQVASEAQERLGDVFAAAARAAGAPLADDLDRHPEPTPADRGSGDEGSSTIRDEEPPSRLTVVPDAPDVESLPIPDYDNLAASQVVPRLEDLADEELRAVQDYERAHRGRMTILSRIAQLQAS